ncbi:MAG: ectoine/hydroxyectoine ABC transporter ATP-binding protein EhuA [Pikeienuella sp.]|uniref:ectoine/hydroxyectoine ABC transporter ATP-binding protein EhuA n=1 Tax=Pikeienuella sp. TaxID=2831957 RepID=UPI00391B4FEC
MTELRVSGWEPGTAETPKAAAAYVEFRSVLKSFGAATVLKDFSLTVPKGQRLALIGPSGSGKTTILRILMTLETIQGGSVWIGGAPLFHEARGDALIPASETYQRRQRRHLGMVFQSFNLFPHLSVIENIAQPQRLNLKRSRAEAEARAMELLDSVGLAHKARAWPDELSGGQKQRVAIARTLAMDPDILLFDEITSALDPELVDEVLSVLRGLSNRTDLTMLLVTHEMGFAREFADRVIFMEAGQIVEDATPETLFIAPAQDRTRQFLRKILPHTR